MPSGQSMCRCSYNHPLDGWPHEPRPTCIQPVNPLTADAIELTPAQAALVDWLREQRPQPLPGDRGLREIMEEAGERHLTSDEFNRYFGDLPTDGEG